jgi:TonB-linked SusC/RagA family outer membrane protein
MKTRKETYLKRKSHVTLLTTICTFLLLCIVSWASAQDFSVKGTVKDAQGETLPGVTISIKGTKSGTLTDVNGNYTIKVPSKESILVFSFVGLQTREYVANKSVINVTLTESTTGLGEVVVVGYGTQKKVAITGSIASVSSKEIIQSSSTNLSSALSGKLSGLSALQNGGGQPGEDVSTIYLRGVSTLNGAQPLIMIDGVPRDNMDELDLNEVQSVSILKDASATAVFGVRGANGVIMITTKRGTEGKAKLDINVEQSYSSFTCEPKRVTSVEYMNLRNLALTNDGLPAAYSPSVIAKYENPLAGLNPSDANYAQEVKVREYMYPNNDWYHMLIKPYTPQTNFNVNVSGGTKQVDYFINAGYIHQGGNLNIAPGLSFNPAAMMNRFTFRSNLDYKITSSLSAFLNLGSYLENDNMPLSGSMYGNSESWMMSDLIYQATSILPITPGPLTLAGFGVPAGKIVDPGYLDRSAYEIMNGRGFQTDIYSNLYSTLGATWDLSKAITPGLSVKGMISFDAYGGTTTQGAITSELYLANIDYITNTLSYAAKRVPGSTLALSSEGAATNYKINMQGSINYNRTFGKHTVGGMFLGQRDTWDVTGGSSDNLIPYNMIGLVARGTYNYDNRYFAEYDMGYNGSEQFSPTNRFGYFPAYSVGWVLTNENFLKNSKILTNLKLRASYGIVGNDQISGNRFLYLDDNTISTGGGYLPSLGLGQQVNLGLVGNPNLQWEVAKKRDFGADFSFFKNLSGSFDYFIEHRSDILITRSTVPAFLGVPSSDVPKANMGIVYNHGYEAELNYNLPINKDLSLNFKGNFSFARDIVKFADEVKKDSTYACRYGTTGYPIGQQFGYKIDWSDHGGYWVSQDEIKNSNLIYQIGTPRVGDFKYIDENHDGVINSKDEVPIGYSSVVPEIVYGLTLGATYKTFDFSIFFQGVAKYSMNYSGQNVYDNIESGTYYDYQMNSWTLARYQAGAKITYPALSTQNGPNYNPNDFFIMNRSFTRLKNIELGYTLPEKYLKSLGINKLRVFVGGQNVCLWDCLRTKHLDPEQNGPLDYPNTKMWNLGLNVSF